jgi:hypothetical protein
LMNAIFWDVMPCCLDQCHNISEDCILHSHHSENRKSYINLFSCSFNIILCATGIPLYDKVSKLG